jgi:hypothetical protein
MIGYDSFSEPPGIHLGTSWTARIAMLQREKEKNICISTLWVPRVLVLEF